MLIVNTNRFSKLSVCIKAAPQFHLSEDDARAIIAHQKSAIEDNWGAVCGEAKLSEVDRALFWRRQFLNPYAFEGLED